MVTVTVGGNDPNLNFLKLGLRLRVSVGPHPLIVTKKRILLIVVLGGSGELSE